MARRTPSAERARRVIALLGRLRRDTRVPLEDLAREVGAPPHELAEDLVALSMSGVWPYDPLALFPVSVEDGDVIVFGEMPQITGPIRLSASEAGALAAALQAAGFDASDELTARLLAAASADFDVDSLERSIRSSIATHDRSVYEQLARAVEARVVVTIEYRGAAQTESTTREIEPVALFTERGVWYVSAWCHTAEDWRTFRLDRIASATETGQGFSPRDAGARSPGAFDTSGLATARLRFAPGEPFDPRSWPGGRIVSQDEDGSLIAEVPFAGTAWIVRRVVACLGRVEALEPENVRGAVHDLATSMKRLPAEA